ncbi:hypothetical protein BDN67DRAFT_426734 [Paxillus ammoniavirescens]|nr:hypothetical protein BDN67DRAFT_426734 [Paxillus ammoniavirescens]
MPTRVAFVPAPNSARAVSSADATSDVSTDVLPELGFRDEFPDIPHDEGDASDRSLMVQFCANKHDQPFASAKAVAEHYDTVDHDLRCHRI